MGGWWHTVRMTCHFEKMTDAHSSPAGRRQWRLAGVLAAVLVVPAVLLLPLAAHGAERPSPAGKATTANGGMAPQGVNAPHAPAGGPPAGRYRCYQPPRFTVVTWFDLEPDGTYQAQGASATPYRYDGPRRQLRWLAGDHAERGWIGLYLPPAADGAGGIRHTIVMTTARNLKPPADERDSRPQCYLTTH